MSGSLIMAAAIVLVTAMLCAAALSAWRGWLELRRLEMRGRLCEAEPAQPAVLIELASLKERLRRLEAIASGVEL